MKKFICRVLLFLAPIVLYFFVCVFPFYFAGISTKEIWDIDKCIEYQKSKKSCLYGLGYDEHTEYYKYINAEYYKAPIIALGTSRVMQFKSYYFNDNFYNCGGAVSGNFDEYKNFLMNLSYKPEAVILGLDAWVFNDAWNKNCTDFSDFTRIRKTSTSKAEVIKKIKEDYKSKWRYSDLRNYPDNIGFNGRVKDNGFMIDGSYYYGASYRFPERQADYMYASTLDRIARGADRFEYGNHIDSDTVNKLDELLDYCYSQGINVIGFLAPFAPQIYKTMIESHQYGYLLEIEPACSELFKKYGFEFYDYMNNDILTMSDENYIDGFHGSEVVYGNIIYDMIIKDSTVSSYVDKNKIKNLINNAYDGLTFYNPYEDNY